MFIVSNLLLRVYKWQISQNTNLTSDYVQISNVKIFEAEILSTFCVTYFFPLSITASQNTVK